MIEFKLKDILIPLESPDEKGSYTNMEQQPFLCAMRLINDGYIITSGYRSFTHNQLVGGTINSQHLYGNAIDINYDNSEDLYSICMIAVEQNATTIIVYNKHIHLDWRDGPFKMWFNND